MTEGNPNIPRVIRALQESENDPNAAIASLEQEAVEHEGEAKALRQAAVAIKLLTGQSPVQPPAEETPSGMEAIRRVMQEGGVWTARAMLEELMRRGWEPKRAKHPLPTVEAAMDRLFRVKREIKRVGRGEYAYKRLPASPSLEVLSQ